jgi:putative transcriptional regulator
MPYTSPNTPVPDDYSDRIKRRRGRLGITQQALADRLGISFAPVNRWENGQTKPSRISWAQIEKLISPLNHGAILSAATTD